MPNELITYVHINTHFTRIEVPGAIGVIAHGIVHVCIGVIGDGNRLGAVAIEIIPSDDACAESSATSSRLVLSVDRFTRGENRKESEILRTAQIGVSTVSGASCPGIEKS